MEEVLRKLYQQQHSIIQRNRINKALDREPTISMNRKKYDFTEDLRLRTPETAFSMAEQIRFEKQFQETQRFRLPDLQEKFQKRKLPLVTNRDRRQKRRRKVRAAFLAVLFLQRIKTQVKTSLLTRKRKAIKYSKHFVSLSQKLIHRYYEKLLKEEFQDYISILYNHLDSPKISQDKQIITMLYYMSEKLAKSTLTKQIIGFFVYTCTEKGFPPSDYLSSAEINRLDFSEEFGCLVHVSEDQVRMLMALGVGIKIFCFYLLYKPWNLFCAGQGIRQSKKKLKEMIKNIGYIFYFILLEDFCLNLRQIKKIRNESIDIGLKPIKQMDPLKEGVLQPTSKSLICNQSRNFLNLMSLKHPNLIKSIQKNLNKWVSRISYATIMESEKRRRGKQEMSSFMSTKYQVMASSRRGNRNVFRSIELKRKGKEISKESKGRYGEFPQLKSTIE